MAIFQTPLFRGDDTLLGVCETLGEDFGFDPLPLRIGLAALLVWQPVVVLAVYGAAALTVVAAHLTFRRPRIAVGCPRAACDLTPAPTQPAPSQDQLAEEETLALAA